MADMALHADHYMSCWQPTDAGDETGFLGMFELAVLPSGSCEKQLGTYLVT